MLDKLVQLADEISSLQSKLILLVGSHLSGKTNLLHELAARRQTEVVHVGATLGRQLLSVPKARRHLMAADLLRELADVHTAEGLIMFDNIELLFDHTLKLNPLDLLKRNAHSRRVIAAWPGELIDNRLTYATMGHPEYQDYGIDGLVPFRIH